MPQLLADNPTTRLRVLSAGLHAAGIAILHQDPEGRYDLAENLPPAWPVDIIGKTDTEAWPAPVAHHMASARRQCLATHGEQVIDLELPEPTRRRILQARLNPDEAGIVITLRDVTDERNREVAVNTLLREVSHRSKNLLAIVQSVAMQTAHHGGDIKEFLDKFRGRLHALSSTQDLVTESNWRGTLFQALVSSQLSRVGPGVLRATRITGDNPLLSPNASLHLGLAIHELAANAVAYGALSSPQQGQIQVGAQIDKPAGVSPQVIVQWQETGIDPRRVRQAPRFGTMVLERIVPLSVGGTASFAIETGKVNYRLVVPADQFEL